MKATGHSSGVTGKSAGHSRVPASYIGIPRALHFVRELLTQRALRDILYRLDSGGGDPVGSTPSVAVRPDAVLLPVSYTHLTLPTICSV